MKHIFIIKWTLLYHSMRLFRVTFTKLSQYSCLQFWKNNNSNYKQLHTHLMCLVQWQETRWTQRVAVIPTLLIQHLKRSDSLRMSCQCFIKLLYLISPFTDESCASSKDPPANEGDIRDVGSIPKSGRSSGGQHGNPLHYSCLKNPMDRGTCELQSIGLQRVEHGWNNLAHMHRWELKFYKIILKAFTECPCDKGIWWTKLGLHLQSIPKV